MKRFLLSACSIVLATAAIAPAAQALPKIDSSFNLQTLRLSEFDTRNKAEDSKQPYYPQAEAETWTQPVSAEEDSSPTAESTLWESPENQEDIASPEPSLTERRQQSLDRS